MSWFLIRSEGRKGGQWGGLGVLPRTLLLLLIPCFSPGSSKVVVGFFNPVYFSGPEFAPTARARSSF